MLEIDGAGKRRHDNELSEGQFRLFGKRRGGGKGVLAVGGEAEDKRSEHMNVMLFEFAQAVGQLRPGGIEIFVNGLQAFLGNCFNPHQGASDVGLSHGIQKLRILGGLHGDLGK